MTSGETRTSIPSKAGSSRLSCVPIARICGDGLWRGFGRCLHTLFRQAGNQLLPIDGLLG